MPVHSLCQKFFRGALRPFHQYRQRALLDATTALSLGASLTLTSIGRYLPGKAQVKNKIKRVARLLGSTDLHHDAPAIFHNLTTVLTRQLSWCVIAVDWSGYPSQSFHVLRASLVCDGRSIPLMSLVVPSSRQQHARVHKDFLDTLAAAIPKDKKVTIITDAGFQSAWFRHVRSLGWGFIGRIRRNIQFRLAIYPEIWLKLKMLRSIGKAKYLGAGTLVRAEYGRCEGHFYLHKRAPKDRKNQRARCRISRNSQVKAGREVASEPWLIFSSSDEFKPREVMKLYSRRMQIEQNFRDEKSERFGFGLRASHSNTAGRILVLILLATLVTIVMWLLGWHAENKGLHLRYQANSLKSRRVISYLTLAENILRRSPLVLKRTALDAVLTRLARTYRSMVLVY